jgi:hypothetical protein
MLALAYSLQNESLENHKEDLEVEEQIQTDENVKIDENEYNEVAKGKIQSFCEITGCEYQSALHILEVSHSSSDHKSQMCHCISTIPYT